MQRWFLSYHTPDQALAERLKAGIEKKDLTSRVFFAPTKLRAGGSWSAQLAQEIADATAFILLIGEGGIGKWQVPEYDEALDRWVSSPGKFPLIVMLLEGQTAPGLPFLRRLHWIVTPDPTSQKDIARLFEAVAGGGENPGDMWRYTSPYRGLAAMEEKDSDYFFGRKRETADVLSALADASDRLPVLIGNSGVGKSSLAQAGVLASLKRQAWPEETAAGAAWPASFQHSRQWCFLSLKPGTEPLKALVEAFLDTWHFAATDPERVKQQHGWIELLRDGKATLTDLIDATGRRRKELDQPEPPAFFLYVDQGEELYARAEDHQRRRFSELLAQALPDPRLHAMMSLRSDFLGHLQNDNPLFKARHQIDVPPLHEAELREIVSRPAQLLAARFESDGLIDIISRRTAEDSIRDVGALPLLSYTLDDMWTQMVRQGDGLLRLPAQSFELGAVLVDRANTFLATHPGSEATLRRVLTLRLATVRDDGEPTRRRAARVEFSDDEWRLVSELADYPNRLLVTFTTEAGETYAEIAHEAIFRRWDKLRDWIAAEGEFLAWRSGLEADRRTWQAAPAESKNDALLMGLALAQAQNWITKRADDVPKSERSFIDLSLERDARDRQQRELARRQQQRMRRLTFATVAVFAVIAAVVGPWAYSAFSKQRLIDREAARMDLRGEILALAVVSGGEAFDAVAGQHSSPYTSALIGKLHESGTSLVEALQNVNDEVIRLTKGAQNPFLSTSMNGNVYLWHQPQGRVRRALVVSEDYEGGWPHRLETPKHDGNNFADLLRDAGFKADEVVRLHNVNKADIEKGIQQACRTLKPMSRSSGAQKPGSLKQLVHLASISVEPRQAVPPSETPHEPVANALVMFYFAGIGFSVDNQNYLLPSIGNDKIETKEAGQRLGLSLDSLRAMISACANASILIMDSSFKSL